MTGEDTRFAIRTFKEAKSQLKCAVILPQLLECDKEELFYLIQPYIREPAEEPKIKKKIMKHRSFGERSSKGKAHPNGRFNKEGRAI